MNVTLLESLNALSGVLFLLTAFSMVIDRQVKTVLHDYIAQSLLLTGSTVLLAFSVRSPELIVVAAITLIAKPIVIPLLLWRLLSASLRTKRELRMAVNTPTSLLVALALSVAAYFLTRPLLAGANDFERVNLPIGLDVVLLGVYTLTVRREALPQLLSLMAIDNGAFFAGIAITHSSALVEFAAALEGVIVAMIVALLTRAIAQMVGTTEVAALDALRERGGGSS